MGGGAKVQNFVLSPGPQSASKLDSSLMSKMSEAKAESKVYMPRTLAERQKEWDRADEDQTKLFDCQWKIIAEQMANIAALVDGLAILRSEVQMLKGDHSDRFDALHDKLGGCVSHEHHASTRERIDYLEKVLGESADKHAAELEATKKEIDVKRVEHHASMEERLKYIEKFLGDSADQHGQNFDAIAGKVREHDDAFRSQLEAHENHARSVQQRLDDLEAVLGDHSAKHGSGLDEAHQQLADVAGRHATFEERVSYLEKELGDSAERHQRHAREIEATKQMMQDEKDAREQHHDMHQQQLDELARAVDHTADSHAKALERWKDDVQDLERRVAEEHGVRSSHHASVEERLAFLEKCVGDSADQHGSHADSLEHLRQLVEEERLSKDKHYEEHRRMLEEMEKRATALDNAHSEHGQGFERIHEVHATIQERVAYIENMMGDSAESHLRHQAAADEMRATMQDVQGQVQDLHGRMQDAQGQVQDLHGRMQDADGKVQDLHGKMQDAHGRIQTHEETRDSHHANVSERLDYLEVLVGDSADKHAQAHERIDNLHQHLAGEADGRGKHKERIENLEKMFEDSSVLHQGHAKELENADRRLTDLHGYIKCEKEERTTIHGSLQQRLEYIEKQVGDSFDKHAKELQDTKVSLQDAHASVSSMREEHVQRHATLEQRVAYAEEILGDSADRFIEKAEMEALCQHIDDLRGHVRCGHATLEQRVEFLESKVCDSMGKYSKELDIVSIMQRQQEDLHNRVTAVSRDLHDMEGASQCQDALTPRDVSAARTGVLSAAVGGRRPAAGQVAGRDASVLATPGRTVFSTPTGPTQRSPSPPGTSPPLRR